MADADEDLGSLVFFQPQWIAMNGGWIHSNNVLFYFSQSPFFDRTSANQTVIVQSQGIPEREFENLSTRQRFEIALSKQIGIQYLVEHDPLESKIRYKGPNGEEQSDVWVIRKQHRSIENNEETIKIIGYYYIMNQAIFQAPLLSSVLAYRMLNTAKAMSDIFSTAFDLPTFTVSHGHSYYKHIQKPNPTTASTTLHSKEATPLPDTQTTTHEKTDGNLEMKATTNSDARLLRQALNMSMRYSKEFMDDMPLTGEPGNFRFAKAKESAGHLQIPLKSQAALSKSVTPISLSRAPSQPPAIQTDVPAVVSKKSAAKSPDGPEHPKPKRRKSKVAISPVEPLD